MSGVVALPAHGIPLRASGRVDEVLQKLETYCRERRWAGYDPYDALNSELFAQTPLMKSRLARLVFTQFLKRSPVNARPLLGIEPRQDPKGLALFLAAYVRLARQGYAGAEDSAREVLSLLLSLRSPETPYWCWGYSFPWQTRHRLVPRFGPNLVATVFAANALLDAHELGLGQRCLDAAASAGDYLAKELYWEDGRQAGFAYPLPDIRVPIHNANFLGAALLCRLADVTGRREALSRALAVAEFSAVSQRDDGSWAYGVGRSQQWVDSFHTGYNLTSLLQVDAAFPRKQFKTILEKGYWFYRDNFFTPKGVPKYFHDCTYPLDIHCAADAIRTLTAFGDWDPAATELRQRVLEWTIGHMWDARGFFCYRILRPGIRIPTPYMRWSLAWMLLAMAAVDEGADR